MPALKHFSKKDRRNYDKNSNPLPAEKEDDDLPAEKLENHDNNSKVDDRRGSIRSEEDMFFDCPDEPDQIVKYGLRTAY